FLTAEECTTLLHLAESSSNSTWSRAMVNTGNGAQIMDSDTQHCGRILWNTPDIAQRLLDRLMPFLEDCGIGELEGRPIVTGIGPARRGERMGGGERSLFTVHLYLNGDGVQDLMELEREIERAERRQGLFVGGDGEVDLSDVVADGQEETKEADETSPGGTAGEEKLLGGATPFTDGYSSRDAVRIFPKAGSILVFQQRNLVHGGDDVFRGVKYTMRTDVMYRKQETS
ncbi:hypothetical protein BBP40_011615, partial [Aspergillus hancockii]